VNHRNEGYAMRLAPILLCLLAACSGGGDGASNEAAAETLAAGLKLQPGEWAVSSETLTVDALDTGRPAIAAKVGGKSENKACITADAAAKPPPALFTGGKDDCTTQSAYISRGRISAQIQCRRPGLDSPYQISVDGSYTADSLTAETSLATQLASDGDVRIRTRLTGRRTGDCPST